MDDLRQQHGNHTWDLIIDYQCCPDCGYILENREAYPYQKGIYKKEFICSRCQHPFVITKTQHFDQNAKLLD